MSALDAGRAARLQLVFNAAWDARGDDPVLYRQRLEDVIDTHQRLVAEVAAERGELPTSFEGAVAVLELASRIIDLIAEPAA